MIGRVLASVVVALTIAFLASLPVAGQNVFRSSARYHGLQRRSAHSLHHAADTVGQIPTFRAHGPVTTPRGSRESGHQPWRRSCTSPTRTTPPG